MAEDLPKVDYVTVQEASKCFLCGQTGKLAHSEPVLGGTLLSIGCENENCDWYHTVWFVELDRDGKVQVNKEAYAKSQATRLQPKLDPDMDRKVEQVHQALDGMIAEMERNPGHGSNR